MAIQESDACAGTRRQATGRAVRLRTTLTVRATSRSAWWVGSTASTRGGRGASGPGGAIQDRDPGQQRREAGFHVPFLVRPPGLLPLPVVLQPVAQPPAQRGDVAPAGRQRRRHPVQTAVPGQQHALQPQGQAVRQRARRQRQTAVQQLLDPVP